MRKLSVRRAGICCLAALWLGLAGAAWFLPEKEISDAERRKLTKFPTFSLSSVASGSFMDKFEDYTMDQFPLRDAFRTAKSLFHTCVLQQKDNHDIYIAQGYAAKLEYPLNTTSVTYAIEKFNQIYNTYLTGSGSDIFLSVVPDKGYYLAEENGYPSMDYEAMFTLVREGMPWAEYVDITDCLTIQDYYRTDTHWRQEKLIPVAQKLCSAMGAAIPDTAGFYATAVERPFYGVYYGQAALPMKSETMYLMENPVLDGCIVTNHELGTTSRVYDMDKLNSRDLYDVYLSGAAPLLTIENPQASSAKELIVFRDSFGSSLVPLMVPGYASVTLVDIRYISSSMLADYLSFHGQDILFLYSTLVLNSSNSLK